MDHIWLVGKTYQPVVNILLILVVNILMVIIWLMVVNHITAWWLLLSPLKNDGVSSSVGMMFHSQLFLESHNPFHGSSHHQAVILFALKQCT